MGAGWGIGGGPLRALGLSEPATSRLPPKPGPRRLAIRSSVLLPLPLPCLSASSWARAGVLVVWALLEAKREVRPVGVVGVPFFMSSAPSRMLEISWLTVLGFAGCSVLVVTPEEALSSWHLRAEVAKDRDVEVRIGCARHCEKTALLADCLYAVGARKGMSECEERMMVSPAFMRSIAARDGVWVLVRCELVCSSEVGRPMVLAAGLPLTVQPSLTDFLCLPVWGEDGLRSGVCGEELPHDSRASRVA